MGKGSVSLEDVHSADLIFVVGQNPGTNHPRMLTALETAKRRGARIVTVNPLPEPGLMRFKNPQTVRGLVGRGTPLADLFLQVRVNGDLALFKALNRLIIDAGAVDQDFVDAHCDGFDELRRDLEALSWPDVEYATGLERARDRARRPTLAAGVRADDRLLGDGPDAAPQRRRDDPRDRQLPAAARQHRPPRRRAVPGARPQQRAGRSHDGDLRAADRRRSSTGWARRSGSSRRASPASTS